MNTMLNSRKKTSKHKSQSNLMCNVYVILHTTASYGGCHDSGRKQLAQNAGGSIMALQKDYGDWSIGPLPPHICTPVHMYWIQQIHV